jgi:hypothetical protein
MANRNLPIYVSLNDGFEIPTEQAVSKQGLVCNIGMTF